MLSAAVIIDVLSPLQDIVLGCLFALGFLVGVISQPILINRWWEWHDFIEDLEDEFDDDEVEDFVDDENLHFDLIIGAMGISSVSDIYHINST